MKYFKYCLKVNRKFILSCLILSLSLDIVVFCIDLENVGVNGFWRPVIISLIITVVVMCVVMAFIYRLYKKNLPVFKVLDEKDFTDKLIDTYRMAFPRSTAMNHIVLASYLKALDRLDEAQQELEIAGRLQMLDIRTKAYYSEVLISLRMRQRRFDEAIMIYNNYNQMMEAYCRSNKDAVCIQHYANGALLYAYSGDFNSAMVCIRKTEPAVKKQRKFAFTRNTALMGVYLLRGDMRSADDIKNMMLTDMQTFDEFDFEAYRQLTYKDIEEITMLFDPRAQAETR